MSGSPQDFLQAVWSSDASTQEFANNPKSFMERFGFSYGENVKVIPHFDNETSVNLVVPESTPEVETAAKGNADPAINTLVKASKDETLKRELLENGKTTLANNGVPVISGINYQVFANTATEMHVVIPTNPAIAQANAELELAAGGLSQAGKCGVGAGGTGVACGAVAIGLGIFTTGATAAIAGGTSAVAAGGTSIGSAVASG